jgi:XTP/dITP diphosphohydrolase
MAHRKLLIATRSKGKFPEITAELAGLPFHFINLRDLPGSPDDYEVEEPATTFEGNAIIKAMTLGSKTGYLVLADDSGLEVDALDGRPGVYSARYAPGSDEDRNRKLLREMDGVPESRRTARFRAVIAVYDPKTDKIRLCEGVSEGRILPELRGSHGFGYDPVFFNESLAKTNAELTLEEKNRISHRGMALREVRKVLEAEFT